MKNADKYYRFAKIEKQNIKQFVWLYHCCKSLLYCVDKVYESAIYQSMFEKQQRIPSSMMKINRFENQEIRDIVRRNCYLIDMVCVCVCACVRERERERERQREREREREREEKKWGRRRPYTFMFVFISPAVFEIQGSGKPQKHPPTLILGKYCPNWVVQGRLSIPS